MNEKIFDIKLTILTPIHIGSAESYNPIDYEIDANELHIIDHDKFIQKINLNETRYKDFLSRIQNFSLKNSSFTKFIREQSKGLYKYSIKIDGRALSYINKNPDEIERAPIEKFIRNTYDDTVYIPGSSMKGALRSAIIELVFSNLLERKDRCEDITNRQGLLKMLEESSNNYDQRDKTKQQITPKPDIVLNENFKYNDAQNDILKYISVSDFYPEEANLEICYPINKGENGKENKIPALLECVMPKSVFRGQIRIKKEFFDKLGDIFKKISEKVDSKIEIKRLERYHTISEFDERKFALWFKNNYKFSVYDCEKKKYGNIDIGSLIKDITKDSNLFLLKIGKHAGALSKTIAGLREITVNTYNPESNRKERQTRKSQTTFWYVDDKPMGWVKGEVNLA